MGYQALEILRQGVWASFTGGWFYDPRQGHFCNIGHLYIWLLLLCLPFGFYMCFASSILVWTVYCASVAAVFTTIKVVNVQLHRVFDRGDYFEESSDDSGKSDEVDVEGRILHSQKKDPENIEMTVLNARREGETPPVQCSSRNSFAEGPHKQSVTQHVDSMELLSRLINSELDVKPCGSRIDLEVDVHHRESSGSSGTESVKQPNTDGQQQEKESGIVSSGFVAEVMQQVGSEAEMHCQKERDYTEDARKHCNRAEQLG